MRLIDADALMQTIKDHEYILVTRNGSLDAGMFTYGIQQAVDEQPTFDSDSLRPKGRWILNRDGSGTCSECHRTRNDVWDMDTWDNYCSHCGADMREDTK